MATILQTVSLKEARFYAPIGYYDEEQIIGNEFFVSIDVCFPFHNMETEDLRNTLNYEELYQIAAQVMRPRRKLLESAAAEILDQIREKVSYAIVIEVVIRKSNPPFGGDLSSSQVSLKYIDNPPN
ncbi:dihydroneopterin aldolase [Sphingobacterium sp. N143]|uniref:dihydroneopterin aldolase n=1 Tax=Sphingobacterium sp. N143 TaxID=2746727 RepID=UPI0025759985|nr:dihydroneopterin aldolase [Sphingobacterium sp. N143]MDM1294644.1 dihydroneopterin aldolase [Sphingobacterium sp. N143]